MIVHDTPVYVLLELCEMVTLVTDGSACRAAVSCVVDAEYGRGTEKCSSSRDKVKVPPRPADAGYRTEVKLYHHWPVMGTRSASYACRRGNAADWAHRKVMFQA